MLKACSHRGLLTALLLLPSAGAWAAADADSTVAPVAAQDARTQSAPDAAPPQANVPPPPAPPMGSTNIGTLTNAPPNEKPSGRFARWFDPSTAPFIPVPEIDVDPVGGATFGVIPVFLTVDEHDEIRRIIAPDIIHSQYFGWGARGRIFAYPSDDSQWSIVGGGKQQVEREFDALYVDGLQRNRPFTWTLHANFDRSGTPRFYGTGNNSPQSQQTNYVDNQGHLEATVGWNISRSWQTSYMVRMGFVQIESAVLPTLPSIQTVFPKLRGIDREEEVQQRLLLTYDTRDSITVPHRGEQVSLFGGFSSSDIWGTVSYSFIGADARVYRPIEPWLTLALHTAFRYMPSDSTAPFWALSSIGGDAALTGERQPLRGFGTDRFIDRNSFVANAELRTRVAQMHVFATSLSLEVTPLLDAGRVFHSMGQNPFSSLHTSAGVGFRAVASPFIVGYLDVGYGKEGATVFTGINYPF